MAREKRKSYAHETYWGKPVANFGDPESRFLIVGLAPAAHGANRTSRMFTGDRSGEWLYRALHRAGFANQATYESADDGLKLKNCIITAVAHCAPPDNKPLPKEIQNCEGFLIRTMELHKPIVTLALGGIAWNAVFQYLKRTGEWTKARPVFKHGVEIEISPGRFILGSYHPSQQNTFTKRLTEEMFGQVFAMAKARLK